MLLRFYGFGGEEVRTAAGDAAIAFTVVGMVAAGRWHLGTLVVVASVYNAMKQASNINTNCAIANVYSRSHNGDSVPAVEIRVENTLHAQLHAKCFARLVADRSAEAREIDVGHRCRRVIDIACGIVAEYAHCEVRVYLIGHTARYAKVIVEIAVDVVFIAR